jgi:hypothetical protein
VFAARLGTAEYTCVQPIYDLPAARPAGPDGRHLPRLFEPALRGRGVLDREVAPVAARVPVITTEFGGINKGQIEPCTAIAAFDERFMA